MNDCCNTYSRSSVFCLLALATACAAGCGDGRPQLLPVSGRVLIDGVPVSHGYITFFPAGGRSASSQLDGQGRFTLESYKPGDGTLPGPQRVAVLARESISEKQAKWHAPKKYANHDTSGIVIEVTEPTNDLKIDLTWGGEKPTIETDS
jgi:hypothetical protein